MLDGRNEHELPPIQVSEPDARPAGGRHSRPRAGDTALIPALGQGGTHGARMTRVARNRTRHRRTNALRGALLGGRVVIALLAVTVVVVSGFAWSTVRQFTASIQHGAALPAAAGKGKAKTSDLDGKDENILLMGNDSRDGATPDELAALGTTTDGGSSATDTMMILHVPADGSKATIISFPRDSWVDIPGHGMSKLNAAFADAYVPAKNGGVDELTAKSAGIALIAQTLTDLTGLHIDHYAMINLLGFYEVSEAIGGVDVCLNAAQNASTEGDASHPNGYSGIDLKAGWNHNVMGKQALAFVRQRHGLPRGDIDRIVRQQYFLSAVFHKATSAKTLFNLGKMRSVLTAVSKTLITDPSLDVISFVQQFQRIAAGAITFGTIPWSFGTQDGLSVVNVDPDAVKQYVAKLVGVSVDPKLAKTALVAPSAVKVTVINGSNTDGIAGRNATALTRSGFVAQASQADAQRAATTIEYPDGMQGQAKTLQKYVPKAQLVRSTDVSGVTLVLGTNGVQAASLMPAAARPSSTPTTTTTTTTAPADTTTAAQNEKGCIN